jgi:hypothetical protein
MIKNFHLKNEREAVNYMLRSVDNLGEIARHIHTVHLARSLSGDYIQKTRNLASPFNGHQNFWEKLDQARRHVARIDRHEPFETPWVGEIFEKIDPAHVVFEFTYNNRQQWERNIGIQKEALQNLFWHCGERGEEVRF